MAEKSQVNQILDDWEQMRESNPRLSLDRYIKVRLKGVASNLVEAFRLQAEELASIDRKIEQVAGPSPTADQRKKRDGNALRLSDLEPGVKPIPGYKLVSRLGCGGFGEVWKAESPGKFHVALKFVQIGNRVGEVEERSLDVIKGVRHPHLLSVFGTWRIGDLLVIATELADRTLLDRLHEAQKEGQLGIPKDELLNYLAEAAKGIDFLNDPGKSGRKRIQHRDIKPQNLLLSGGSVKVGDFGLARVVQSDIASHTGSMTFAYAAPEWFAGKTSHSGDQYSLAITYCYLRGGRLPFEGSEVDVMNGHLRRPPDLTMLPPEERYPVAKALAKSSTKRWSSCQDFIKAITKSTRQIYFVQSAYRVARMAIFLLVTILILAFLIFAVSTSAPSWRNIAARFLPEGMPSGAGYAKDDATPSDGSQPATLPGQTGTAVAIDSERLVNAASEESTKRAEIQAALEQIFENYPLNVMTYDAHGNIDVHEGREIRATLRCKLAKEPYRKLCANLASLAKRNAILSGEASVPLDRNRVRLNFDKLTDFRGKEALVRILDKRDPYSEQHCFLVVGSEVMPSHDGKENELLCEWFVLPKPFGTVLLAYFKSSARVSVRCDLLNSNGQAIATRIIEPAYYNPRYPKKSARLPFYPVSTSYRSVQLDLDYDSDRYMDENTFVFLPTLLVPQHPQYKFTQLVLAEERISDIPLAFNVSPADLKNLAQLRIEASIPPSPDQ